MAAPKEISLRRATQSMDLMRDFSTMLTEEELVDVELVSENGSLSAHRMVLASCSPYFRTIFSRLASVNKNQYPVVILKDIPFVDLKAIIEFIYRGEVIIPQSQLPSLIKSAAGLQIRGLDNDFENVPEASKKKKRKRRRRSSKDTGSVRDGASVDEDESQSPSDASTDDDDDHRTQIASVPEDRTSISTVGDVEPSRLLEQTMTITGDAAEQSHRFSQPLHQSSVASNDPNGLIPNLDGLNDPIPAHPPVALVSFDANHMPLPGPSSGQSGHRQSQGEIRSYGPSGLRSSDRLVNCVPLEMHHHPLHHIPLISGSSSSGNSSSSQQQQAMSSRDDLLRRSRYPCPICLKQFSERGNMKRHMTIHEQQRHRYICEICSRCFSWKDNYHRHRRTHHE